MERRSFFAWLFSLPFFLAMRRPPANWILLGESWRSFCDKDGQVFIERRREYVSWEKVRTLPSASELSE